MENTSVCALPVRRFDDFVEDHPPMEGVASFFLALADRCRSDIADYLGLTKETVSRVFAEMKSTQLIRLRAIDRIEILDRSRRRQITVGE